jgi:hypothetical protein
MSSFDINFNDLDLNCNIVTVLASIRARHIRL